LSPAGISPNAPIQPGVVNSVTGMGWHSGGIVGTDVPTFMRNVPSILFENAPRYHLGVDEVPAILQRGERVMSIKETKQQKNADAKSSEYDRKREKTSINLKVVNVMDKREILNAMTGIAGEQVIINAIKRNRRVIAGVV